MYLPLDQLIQKRTMTNSELDAAKSSMPTESGRSGKTNLRNVDRTRGTR
jgi:hypothetical protein